ncbi:hypothetical protein [Nonomuraea typhae]|uniref:Uncharacterized protein n=1 Tax=Nonomuraea typhae TaxID=2603600 RepID=A0ABW7YL71_9ACTN
MRSGARRILCALCIALLSLGLGFVPAANAGTTPPTPPAVDADGWLTKTPAPAGAELVILSGKKTGADGCVIPIELKATPGDRVVRADETRINLRTCQLEVAVRRGDDVPKTPATQPSPDVATKEAGPAEPAKIEEPAPSQLRPAQKAKAGWTRTTGYFRTWWTDPIGLTVNSTRNNVSWDWNNVNCVSPGWGSANYEWLSGTGWAQLGENFQNLYGCTDQRSESYAHYANQAFCGIAIPAAHVYYPRNYVRGWWNGEMSGYTDSYADSGCSFLLTRHHQLEFS